MQVTIANKCRFYRLDLHLLLTFECLKTRIRVCHFCQDTNLAKCLLLLTKGSIATATETSEVKRFRRPETVENSYLWAKYECFLVSGCQVMDRSHRGDYYSSIRSRAKNTRLFDSLV